MDRLDFLKNQEKWLAEERIRVAKILKEMNEAIVELENFYIKSSNTYVKDLITSNIRVLNSEIGEEEYSLEYNLKTYGRIS